MKLFQLKPVLKDQLVSISLTLIQNQSDFTCMSISFPFLLTFFRSIKCCLLFLCPETNKQKPDAARIKRITEMVLMDEGKDAVLECEVDANPISTVVITWRRRRNSTSSDILDPPTPTLLTGLGGNGIVESSSSSSSSSPNLLLVDEGGKNNSNLNFRTKQTMERNRSLLIIHNVSRDDSGSYDCLAFNGIGYEDSATANLVVKREFFLPSLKLFITFFFLPYFIFLSDHHLLLLLLLSFWYISQSFFQVLPLLLIPCLVFATFRHVFVSSSTFHSFSLISLSQSFSLTHSVFPHSLPFFSYFENINRVKMPDFPFISFYLRKKMRKEFSSSSLILFVLSTER